ncbi:GNAT family N-acetyltransferase [Streptomyces sp. MA5143a]|uniref:GNAT family N-acetyltransferase n=1 Tax=Streptomyces sp. MA5143a TaxID=2083010 RepID=UPI000D1BD09E|nr:GNAT family N-acetyltransferase [Streptomyces sp. MA5143a]SPF00041.1 N-acyltransferase YncA [Streptomyces sp. MA5143a]
MDDLHDLRVRHMALTDCRAVAEIRVDGWRTAYAGLVPRSYLDGLDVAEDAEMRRGMLLKAGNPVVNLVAERAGEALGWAAYGPYREGDIRTGDAELYAIYVRPGHLGGGVGGALLRTSLDRCRAAGYPRVFLWVFKENTRAGRFYEQHGFAPDGVEGTFEVDGVEIPELRYALRLGPGENTP